MQQSDNSFISNLDNINTSIAPDSLYRSYYKTNKERLY